MLWPNLTQMDSKIYFMFKLDIFYLVAAAMYNHKVHVSERDFEHTINYTKILLFRKIVNA